jgi:hypothetical protein
MANTTVRLSPGFGTTAFPGAKACPSTTAPELTNFASSSSSTSEAPKKAVVSSSIWPGSGPVVEAGFGLRGAMAKTVHGGEKGERANDLVTKGAVKKKDGERESTRGENDGGAAVKTGRGEYITTQATVRLPTQSRAATCQKGRRYGKFPLTGPHSNKPAKKSPPQFILAQ